MNQDTSLQQALDQNDSNLLSQAAFEKLAYMYKFAKSSTIATVLAPLLAIPLYLGEGTKFYYWLLLMTIAVITRFLMIRTINLEEVDAGFKKFNFGTGCVTLMWGLGWLFLNPISSLDDYLIYQLISLTVLFVGMVGYCVNWNTFLSFVLLLKIPEAIFTLIHYDTIYWPVALGSMVTFYLALKMGFLFSESWEKSILLRNQNNDLVKQLIAEKDSSIAANLAKSEFIATASHDLRQPMQAINILLELIPLNDLKEKEKIAFTKIRSSIDLLNKMFNTLLDISKLDANSTTIVQGKFHIKDLLTDIKENFIPIAQKKKLNLAFNSPNLQITGDKFLLGQILRNLLSNAIQYTDQGSIEVNIENDFEGLILTVKDTGCGIPENDLPKIFNEFYRSEHSRIKHDGLGLGLSIVNRISKIINASINIETKVNQGTKFTVKTKFKATFENTIESENLDTNENSSTTNNPHKFKGVHLGLIENDDSLLYAYQQFFSESGFLVYTIPYSDDLLQKALEDIPHLDFILSDYRLGEKDGTYFIKKLREEFNTEIPACIVTADTSPSYLNLFKNLNIDVLHKPIEITDVLLHIEGKLTL